ncbi:MAG: hypothetical protein ABIN25_13365, partial [Ginsengibacter sp.]
MKMKFCLLVLVCTFFAKDVVAQQASPNTVTGNFNALRFDEFVQRVESQTSFHFYYDPSQFDSLTITISLDKAFLPSVLDKIFNSTDWHYIIDKENHVFITKGFTLAADLPYGFFTGKKDTSVTIAKNSSVTSGYLKKVKNEKLDISVENKLHDIGIKRNEVQKGNVNVAGYVRDEHTGESLSGALIYVDRPQVQVSTDQFGYYSLVLPAGRHILNI